MEVSSHALAQHRVDGIVFDVAVFTNLSQDHLDYHGTMESYLEAKAVLFTPDHAVRGLLNADDPSARRLLRRTAIPVVTYGVERDADLRASDVAVDARGTSFHVEGVEVRSALLGRFNVWNCLAAMGAAREVGIPLEVAARALGEVRDVPGRMETIDAGQDFLVVVDYAHTPDSIRVVLRGARSLAAGRVIVVFGCGGDRDRAKRAPMGQAATSSADLSVITTDNPRSEDPLAIIGEIVPGAVAGGGTTVVDPDRRHAIRLALREAKPGDIVVIAGQGSRAVPRGGRDRGAVRRSVDRPGRARLAPGGGVKPRPLSSVAAAVGGERTGDDVDVSSVTTDSRQAGPGALFVALEGERTDGHRFVLDALARGAAAVLVREAADAPAPKIQVASTADALLRLAADERRRFDGTVVAIAGANGKTSTKDMTAAVVSTRFRAHASPGSFNNEVGVPLTFLELRRTRR